MEEIELFITISKNYISQERKTLRKLSIVETKLERKKGTEEEFKYNMTVEYFKKVEANLREWLNTILIQVDALLLPMINHKIQSLQDDFNRQKQQDDNVNNNQTTFGSHTQNTQGNTQSAGVLHTLGEQQEEENPMSLFAMKQIEESFAVEKITCLRFKGDLYRYTSDINTGFEQKLASEYALKSYQEAAAESCKISQAHPITLKLALSHSMYYYEVLNSVEFAMKIIGETIADAKDEYFNFKRKANDAELRAYNDSMKTLDHNLQKWKEELLENAKEYTNQNQ
ncbi:UNKNOWN [Stylonychia lemnae]|uniref:14-3-3 domain-containing protein n=1 Tax=Stylonychia lemnae TaxID=5949 RepID=A0A078AVU0_STYLE|nr:UNKNOWN [Stylonychia lemnae]|eukprot:CDW84888.1 UNKNOWN [Stylonychia lemnae]